MNKISEIDGQVPNRDIFNRKVTELTDPQIIPVKFRPKEKADAK